ncbi:MAG: class I SAM-dependent methyltransferase [Paludibacteraceae bacterium]
MSLLTQETRILEIGSGAFGLISFFPESNCRYGIDPLEYYYSTVNEFVNQRDSIVTYSTGKGEKLAFEDSFFDIILLDNVLDHCESPNEVLKEIKRVAKPQSFIFFRQNTYNCYGKLMRNIMEFFLIDKGHPYTFTKSNITRLFKNDFELIDFNRNGYCSTWKAEITSNKTIDKIKAILFITRDKSTYFWRKK